MTIENETINFFFEGEVDNADYVLMSRVDIKKERGAETSELDQSETESKKRYHNEKKNTLFMIIFMTLILLNN